MPSRPAPLLSAVKCRKSCVPTSALEASRIKSRSTWRLWAAPTLSCVVYSYRFHRALRRGSNVGGTVFTDRTATSSGSRVFRHRRNSASLSAVQIDTAATWPVACTPRSVRHHRRWALIARVGRSRQREHGRLHSVLHRSHCGRRSTRGHGAVAPPCFLGMPPAERGAIVLQHQLDTAASGGASTRGTQSGGRSGAASSIGGGSGGAASTSPGCYVPDVEAEHHAARCAEDEPLRHRTHEGADARRISKVSQNKLSAENDLAGEAHLQAFILQARSYN